MYQFKFKQEIQFIFCSNDQELSGFSQVRFRTTRTRENDYLEKTHLIM